MAVRCSKDLAGHWLLPCPWPLILASGPEHNSHLYQVANVFYASPATVSFVIISYPHVRNISFQEVITRSA